jgi:micrococcal nuclease
MKKFSLYIFFANNHFQNFFYLPALLGIFFMFLISACGLKGNTVTPQPNPAYTEVSIRAINLPACLRDKPTAEPAEVLSITDGDTIHVSIQKKEYKLRYVGINTPEINEKREFFGVEASEKNKELVNGKRVFLIKDRSNVDQYGRLLRYVIVDNTFVNLQLVREGFAFAKDYPPDTACSQSFYEAEKLARQEKLGIWNNPSKK